MYTEIKPSDERDVTRGKTLLCAGGSEAIIEPILPLSSPTNRVSGLPPNSSFYGDKLPFWALPSTEEPLPVDA